MKLKCLPAALALLCLNHTPAMAADNAVPPAAPAAAANPVFDVLDFQIDGNTVLDDETLERTVYPFLGPEKTVDDVEKARVALEEAYRKAGYPTVVVAIPEQDINAEGRVQINVLEGRIETQHITGARYYALGKIRESVPALAEGVVPHMPTVQNQMTTLAQQAPDRTVTPVFRAGSTPGQMEVELKVKDAVPLHGSVEMNSRNTSNTSYTRLIGSLRYDNLWQKYHSASVQYQLAPEVSNQLDVWSGTYVLPTGFFDTRLALYGINISSNTQLGASVGGTTVVGTGSIIGARLVKPLFSEGGVTHSLTAGLDYKDFDQAVNLLGQDTGKTKIQYTRFVTGFDGSWRDEVSTTTLNLTANYGLRILGNDPNEFNIKRTGATPDFFYLTGDFRHQHVLPLDFRLQTRAQGQGSMSRLISNEQFSAGGPLSVRGYHQTQVLADQGVNLSIELHSPKLLAKDWESAQNLRVLTFFDWANLWTMAPIAPTSSTTHLASTGVGLRTQWFKHLLGEFDWSYPIYQQGSPTSSGHVLVGQQRVDFRVVYEF
ncbi:ShlB/FhaC/HecB family hemolysin secretion/activation protein [Methylomonas paludis]|uniref:ShlB/FhaC/HecB family hemolysin secretion/activation protein n=1 Tax=Methylomonas paludis TaxID=1173101 RepID=A0A975R8X4_9GAMM|nr:ShlB/FhaC/HecB family hemolysin secretion/activation protein [Methylomonas paludis]QWF69576.1 ShlB/FhaC/HecB family hemolysin secretion/activation protein [Methylomonas paludis]